MRVWLLLTLTLAILVSSVTSNPVAKPIHGLLPYYRKQEQQKLRLRNSRLRYRCESQLLSSYGIPDRECQEWLAYEFINASPKSSSPMTAFSLCLTVLITMLTFRWCVPYWISQTQMYKSYHNKFTITRIFFDFHTGAKNNILSRNSLDFDVWKMLILLKQDCK